MPRTKNEFVVGYLGINVDIIVNSPLKPIDIEIKDDPACCLDVVDI